MNPAQELFENGVTVIKPRFLSNNLDEIRTDFDEAIKSFKEFKIHPSIDEIKKDIGESVSRYALGGTSFIGNPSAFHAPFFRKMREIVMFLAIRDLFKEYKSAYLSESYNLEQIMDRIMIRPAGDVPCNESWHRDESPMADVLNGDLTFGGWVNYDKEAQYFSCVPGTHKNLDPAARDPEKGFHKVAKKDIPTYERHKALIEIKPGEMIVFIEDLVHEIVSNAKSKRKFTSIRQFFGWRFTKQQGVSIHKNLDELLEKQSVIPLKSGQIPAIIPKIYDAFPTHKRKRKRFVDAALVSPEILNNKTRNIDSLKEAGLPLYPAYSEREKKLLLANNTFELRNPDTNEIEIVNI